MLFALFYYILALILYIISFPFLLYLPLKEKYKLSIKARFFLYKNGRFPNSNIHFHACSLGEVKSLKPILDKLDKVNISVITETGYLEAKKFDADVRFLPFEIFLPFWLKRASCLVVTEAELWFLLFFIAKKKGAKTILLNARISDKSYNSYKRFKFFYKKIFENIDVVFAQSSVDKYRLLELGAKDVRLFGNIKLLNSIQITKEFIKPNRVLICAGSTHSGEEEIVLKAFKELNYSATLVIVPRHPERFLDVNSIILEFIKDTNFSYHKFSTNESFNSDIVLVDKLGELNNIYAISDIVILGGAFAPIGGHNPVEPAYFGCKIISGKNIFNQKALFERVLNVIFIEEFELKDTLQNHELIQNSKLIQGLELDDILKELHVV